MSIDSDPLKSEDSGDAAARRARTRRSVYKYRESKEQIYLLVDKGDRARLHAIVRKHRGHDSIQGYLLQICENLLDIYGSE